jgi:hypothetical protein
MRQTKMKHKTDVQAVKKPGQEQADKKGKNPAECPEKAGKKDAHAEEAVDDCGYQCTRPVVVCRLEKSGLYT